MSLKSFVIPGTKDDAYFIIFEITDQAYLPNLSSLEIKDFKSTLSEPILMFGLVDYSPVSRLIASITLVVPVLFIL
jgi:hypothetical protein